MASSCRCWQSKDERPRMSDRDLESHMKTAHTICASIQREGKSKGLLQLPSFTTGFHSTWTCNSEKRREESASLRETFATSSSGHAHLPCNRYADPPSRPLAENVSLPNCFPVRRS